MIALPLPYFIDILGSDDNIRKMVEKNYFIELTLVLYRVTEFFPAKEPLRFLIREKANGILADLISEKKEKNKVLGRILGNIEVLQAYFEVAKEQNWVKKENFLVLGKEYSKVGEEILRLEAQNDSKQGSGKGQGRVRDIADPTLTLKNRQRRILQVLREKQQAQIQDFKEIFPEVTKRTLRRDFDELLKKGLVQRLGDKNKTVYKLE